MNCRCFGVLIVLICSCLFWLLEVECTGVILFSVCLEYIGWKRVL